MELHQTLKLNCCSRRFFLLVLSALTVCLLQREGESDAAIVEYLCNPKVEFNPEAASVLQLVCRVDLGGSFRPDLHAVLEHPQLRTAAIDTRDGVAVRIPQIQENQETSNNFSADAPDEFGKATEKEQRRKKP